MLQSIQIARAIKSAARLPSDYALGKLLGATPQSVHGWMRRGTSLDPMFAGKAGEALGIDPKLIVLATNWERSKSDIERETFEAAYYAMGGAEFDRLVEKLLIAPTAETKTAPDAISEAVNPLAERGGFEPPIGY